MAERETSANILVCESQEALYSKAVKKMKADRLIIQHAFKIENYLTAAAMFDEVGAYLDSAELAAECRSLAEEARAEQRESQYQKAVNLQEKAVSEEDYQKAAAIFAELGVYKNAQQKKEECEGRIKELNRRVKRKCVAIGLVGAVLIGLIAVGFVAGFFRYAMGLFYSTMGYYEKAGQIFDNLDGLLDSETRALECQELVLRQQEEKNLLTMQKADAGDRVVFGSNQWIVLERRDQQICLVLENVAENGIFYQVAYDETGKTAVWDDASLSDWLNTEVRDSIFDEEELEAMIPLGEWFEETATEEYVTILSAQQVMQYEEQTAKLTGSDYWLKDQGNEEDMAAFVSAAGEVMEYGYPVEAKMSVRPVIVVDCSRLTEEEEA